MSKMTEKQKEQQVIELEEELREDSEEMHKHRSPCGEEENLERFFEVNVVSFEPGKGRIEVLNSEKASTVPGTSIKAFDNGRDEHDAKEVEGYYNDEK